MFLNKIDNHSQEALTPEGLCNLIEMDFIPDIQLSLEDIQKYFDKNIHTKADPVSAELVALMFIKLKDELDHLFRKEKGILFPFIKQSFAGTMRVGKSKGIDAKVIDSLNKTQKGIIQLLQKMRQVLNNYSPLSYSTPEWKDCVNDMFELENKIFQWIHIEQTLLYPKVVEHKPDFLYN